MKTIVKPYTERMKEFEIEMIEKPKREFKERMLRVRRDLDAYIYVKKKASQSTK